MSQRNTKTLIERLTRFSLERRITVLVLLLTIIVVGAVAALGIPIELIPSGFSEPFLRVTVPWRDAPAPEVQEKITLPLEEELSSVRGLSSIDTRSSTGRSRVALRFRGGTDMAVAYREVRDRIERARARMPTDADRVFIRKHDDSGIPVAVFGLAVDPTLADVYSLIQNEVVLPLSRIDGVASVVVDGLEEKEILIEVDRARAEAAGVNIFAMANDLGGDNFTMASGTVVDASRKLLLRSIARYESLEDLERRPVGPTARLGDIARISYDEPQKDYRVRVNSLPAYAVVVFKEGQANTLEVSAALNREFAKAKTNPRLQKVETLPIFVQGDIIRESLDTLRASGLIGGGLAVLVLFVFLRRFRLTAIITLSIPLSIVVALGVMYFAGDSLNILSLLALMISVGLLVDNSVVVAENIHRRFRAGADRRTACLEGAAEIALAITTATLTTVVVFVPVALVEGPGQFFLRRLATPIGVSLTASLVVALVFVPLAVYLTLPERHGKVGDGGWARAHQRVNAILRTVYDHTLERVNRAYVRLLAFCLGRRLDLVLALLAVLAATGFLAHRHIRVTEQQDNERAGFEVEVEMPAASSLNDTALYFHECETVLAGLKQELDLNGYFLMHRARGGRVEGWFNNPRKNTITPREVTKRVLEALPKRPGITHFAGNESDVEEAKGKGNYVVPLFSDDHQTLESVASELESFLVTLPGVVGIKKQAEEEVSELALVVDREGALRHGVSPRVISGVVGSALRGASLPRFHRDGKDIPVRVRFREEDRKGLDELAAFAVPTRDGTLPLGAVTDAHFLPSYGSIHRRDKQISRTITLQLEEGKEEATRERLAKLTRSLDLPEGVAIGVNEATESLDRDTLSLVFAGLLSIVFIYLLMGMLFESSILPLSILLTIPLAGIGVVWAHLALRLDIDFLGVVGAILLIGVVVNNGIVLIDYVIRLRADGHDREAALLLASEHRFRPIMMTALTTIIGMVPLTLGGASSIGWSYKSFGLTLIGGMSTSTLLTLLVVPVFYTLFDDARVYVGGAVTTMFRRGTAGVAAGE